MAAALETSLNPRSLTPKPSDRVASALAAASLALLYLPTCLNLATKVWGTIEQSYGPVILAAALWLAWKRRFEVGALQTRPATAAGFVLLACGMALYAIGTSQDALVLATGSAVPTVIALLLLAKGWRAVRVMSLPLVLLAFVTPLPADLVAALTGPLKSAVSAVAASILRAADYPVGRSGVILTIGQYQLLVADACAGLTSMFTLEAIGLVYMGLRAHPSKMRNTVLALLLIPIAFVANVVRVLILVLVTYYLGDEAGRGFVHNLAGILLFAVAAGLMIGVDSLLELLPWKQSSSTPGA